MDGHAQICPVHVAKWRLNVIYKSSRYCFGTKMELVIIKMRRRRNSDKMSIFCSCLLS